jgi:hypothetical protein
MDNRFIVGNGKITTSRRFASDEMPVHSAVWKPPLPGLVPGANLLPVGIMGIVKLGTFPALFGWKAGIYRQANS